MQIIKRFLGRGNKAVGEQINQVQPSQIKQTFDWPESLRPFAQMQHAVVRIFPADANRITIIVPGYGSSGKKPKYEDIISVMMEKGRTAVISTNNPDPFEEGLKIYAQGIKDQIMALVQYSIQNAKEITGRENVKITLYGSSAGGGAVALVAGYFPDIIDSIILTGPSRDVTQGLEEELQTIIKPFYGQVFLISTADDGICNADTIAEYSNIFSGAREFKTKTIPGNDHAFELPQNHVELKDFVVSNLSNLSATEA